jgi:NADH:ubiquinone reductase (H+-translocating)
MKKIVVVGGGFAGLAAALNAVDEIEQHGGDIGVTMVSPSPYLTMRPRLYEKHPETLRTPLLPVLDPANVGFIEGNVEIVDAGEKELNITTAEGGTNLLAYERLILATGSELRQLPIPGVAENSFNIDTYASAVTLDQHLKLVATTTGGPGHNTFVIVGAGMSGIELATEMRDRIAEHSDAETAGAARIILVDQADRVGPGFGEESRPIIEEALSMAGVEVKLGASLAKVEQGVVFLSDGTLINTATTVITIGLRASALGEQISEERDELGRLVVDEMLRVRGVAGVFATGDVARADVDEENVALMSCQHARSMGKYAGYNAAHDLMDLPLRPYAQSNYTTCLDLGKFGAVFTKGWDRRVEHFGAKAKQRKHWINTELIYPPQGDRATILAAMRINKETGR